MADIVAFTRDTTSGETGEAPYATLEDGWAVVRLLNSESFIRECGRLGLNALVTEDRLAKMKDRDYDFLVVRDPSGATAMLLVVDIPSLWIEDLYHGVTADRIGSLRALAPLVAKQNWRKHYQWSHGYLITDDGKLVSVNALPDCLLVNGDITIFNHTEVSLPSKMHVIGSITLHTSTFKKVPRSITCLNLTVVGCTMPQVATRLKIEGDVQLTISQLDSLADIAVIKNDLQVTEMRSSVALPDILRVGQNIQADADSIASFGPDTIVLGDMKIKTKHVVAKFALDLSGRVIRNGEIVTVFDVGSVDAQNRPIQLENRSAVDAIFNGQFKNGKYTCHVYDPVKKESYILNPWKKDVLSKATIKGGPRIFP